MMVRLCQGNSARSVRGYMSAFGGALASVVSRTGYWRGTAAYRPPCRLDRCRWACIIRYTPSFLDLGGTSVPSRSHLGQGPPPQTARRLLPRLPGRLRSSVPGQRLLRPTRHRSGQVRDAAARARRRPTGDRGSEALRLLPPVFLPCLERSQAAGTERARSREAWPARATQVHPRGGVGRSPGCGGGPLARSDGVGRHCGGTTGGEPASTHYQSWTQPAEKKCR